MGRQGSFFEVWEGLDFDFPYKSCIYAYIGEKEYMNIQMYIMLCWMFFSASFEGFVLYLINIRHIGERVPRRDSSKRNYYIIE